MPTRTRKHNPPAPPPTNGHTGSAVASRRGPISEYHGKRERSYVTTLGVAVMISALPPLLPKLIQELVEQEWRDAGKALPTPPTYTVKNVAGDVEVHLHEVSADGKQTTLQTDEDRAAWQTYRDRRQTLAAEVTNRTFEEVAHLCLRFDIDPAWANRYARLHPPTSDPDALQWFYTRAAVIGSGDDVKAIMAIASELTGVDARLIQAVEDSFPSDMAAADAGQAGGEPDGGLVL